jgi:predicted dehydrogenase
VTSLPQPRYRTQLRPDLDSGIGIIGAGTVIQGAHLPGYRKAGFRVCGLYDLSRERAEKVAAEYGIKAFESIEALLDDPEISVVDIAVPASQQLTITRQVTAAGKHLMCQKPLAETFEDATEIVRLAEQAGVTLAVNQNSRWSPGVRSSRFLVGEGWIGQPLIGQMDVSFCADWGIGILPPYQHNPEALSSDPTAILSWIKYMPKLLMLQATIHHVEAMRSIFGTPSQVYAVTGRDPGQPEIGETRALLSFQFDAGLVFAIKENARNCHGDAYARYRFEGSAGVIDGTLGGALAPGVGAPDTLRLTSERLPDYTFEARFTETRFPDSFVGTMGELLTAIKEGREPEHSGRDNLNLLRIMFAAYRSAEENRPVAPEEIG